FPLRAPANGALPLDVIEQTAYILFATPSSHGLPTHERRPPLATHSAALPPRSRFNSTKAPHTQDVAEGNGKERVPLRREEGGWMRGPPARCSTPLRFRACTRPSALPSRRAGVQSCGRVSIFGLEAVARSGVTGPRSQHRQHVVS